MTWTREQVQELEFCEFPGGYSPSRTAGESWFDVGAAFRAVSAGPLLFKHQKGAKGGQPLNPERWQACIYATLFGWKRKDGLRRYRKAYIEIPRGNGKSTMCVVIVGLLLYLDDEPGADIFSAAGTREQAKEVFGPFKANVLTNPSLKRISKDYVNSVARIDPRTGLPVGVYKAISADADYQHGGSPHGVIFDELHVQPDRELWDVLDTGNVKRTQPLTVAITTAGYDRSSICWEQHQHAEMVRDGVRDDPEFLPVIYAASPEDDWKSPTTWAKANPNLGVSITEEAIAAKCRDAQNMPSFENTFKRLHLNLWTEQAERYLQMDKWDACKASYGIKDMLGRRCFGGFDLASTRDTNAFVLLFPTDDDKFRTLSWFWAPKGSVSARAKQDRREVLNWGTQGFITLTDGDMVDCRRMAQEIIGICSLFDVHMIGYDKAGIARPVMQMMQEEGFDIERRTVEYSQGVMSMSAPTKTLDIIVGNRRLEHNGDPVLRWMASNLAVHIDHKDNHQPSKKNSSDKIDGIVALIMALGLSMKYGDVRSVYENRGIITL